MRTRLSHLAVTASVAVSGGWGCSNECPNCPGGGTSLQVSPGTTSVLPGRTVQLAALVYDRDGALLNGFKASWSSSDQSVASVDSTGLVTGLAVGSVTITASVAGLNADGTVNVVTTSTLSGQVQPILQTSCATAFCHVSPGPSPTMTSASVTYNSLVASGTTYVTPGDTTVGLLLQRLKSTTAPMPPGAPLSQLQPGNYDLIALWIAQGAQNN